jgi:hypothetical protein
LSESELTQARAFSERFAGSDAMIVQHGKIVAECGDTAKRMEPASIRKSLLRNLTTYLREHTSLTPKLVALEALALISPLHRL